MLLEPSSSVPLLINSLNLKAKSLFSFLVDLIKLHVWITFRSSFIDRLLMTYHNTSQRLLKVKVTQSCPSLCNPMGWNSPDKNTAVRSFSLLHSIFPTRNWTGVSCIVGWLYQLSYQESPNIEAIENLPNLSKDALWLSITFTSYILLWLNEHSPPRSCQLLIFNNKRWSMVLKAPPHTHFFKPINHFWE